MLALKFAEDADDSASMNKISRFAKIGSLTAAVAAAVIGGAYASVAVDSFVIWTNHGLDAIECNRAGCKTVVGARTEGEVSWASLQMTPSPPVH